MNYPRSIAFAIAALVVLSLTPVADAAPPPPEVTIIAPSSIEAGEPGVVAPFVFNNSNQPLAGPVTIVETVSPGAELSAPSCFCESALDELARRKDQNCELSGRTWTCIVDFESPGMRGGVLLRSSDSFQDGQLISAEPGASGDITIDVRVTSANAPAVEAQKTVRIGPPGPYEFGWKGALRRSDRSPFATAGSTPDSFLTDLSQPTFPRKAFGIFPAVTDVAQQLDEVVAHLPPGFIGNPQAVPTCPFVELQHHQGNTPTCPRDSQVGLVKLSVGGFTGRDMLTPALFNLEPSVGSPARFGFEVFGVPVVLTARLNPDDYSIDLVSSNTSSTLALFDAEVEVWGVPTDPSHDGVRGRCLEKGTVNGNGNECPSALPRTAFLRTPTRCEGPLRFGLEATTYQHPELVHEKSFELPVLQACDKIPFDPDISVQATSLDAESPTGLHATVQVPNTGLENPDAVSESDIKAVKVALPRGVTLNPSQAEGLGVCTEAQYESSELSFHPDGTKGCPADSKIGTVEVHTPLLKETIPGNVYVAKPYDNPFDSLLAIYVVLEEPMRGVLVKLAGKVEPDEKTGKIVTTFSDLPQQPFSSFEFKFREGARAPLVTPSTCGTYTTDAEFTPWANPDQVIKRSTAFQITRGIGGAPCPKGAPGFKPGFSAGSINNNAGSFSAFDMRLTRQDGEQDMTRFSTTLPPGVLGKLAGVSKCPETAIAIAKAKTGLDERANPSCPASSEIGHSLVGAGVGSVLTYIPGKIYLGGPFHGDPLSVIAITPAVAGPFDVGTVVVHEALTLNPKTAEVEVDGAASDPIPHILKGIPAKVRDLRVYVDKPNFILNPTSCAPSATEATLSGGGADPFSVADDVPVALTSRYQAAGCQGLGFKPSLALNLKGGTKRGEFPALKALYKPRKGDANVKGLVVRLPRSAFLEQGHIRTICTRVQFAADNCPKASVYGQIKAWTPLLEDPLEGPVYLRSSSHKLPDLVFDLHGLVDVEVSTRIDSSHGGIRATVQDAPDAPISKVLLKMQGAEKGLIVNSRNLCGHDSRANVEGEGQNGKQVALKPVLRPDCGGKGRKKKR